MTSMWEENGQGQHNESKTFVFLTNPFPPSFLLPVQSYADQKEKFSLIATVFDMLTAAIERLKANQKYWDY